MNSRSPIPAAASRPVEIAAIRPAPTRLAGSPAVDLDRSLPPHLGPIKAGTAGANACGQTRADRNARLDGISRADYSSAGFRAARPAVVPMMPSYLAANP
jgi:hypothetical protein